MIRKVPCDAIVTGARHGRDLRIVVSGYKRLSLLRLNVGFDHLGEILSLLLLVVIVLR